MEDELDDNPNACSNKQVKALVRGFVVMRGGAKSEKISILNHQAPFFQLACQCEFSDEKLLTKQLLQAD
ncbi:hypothetical protein O5O45_19800 [Hahella aquimaris]|uniref:hypothetical protein n=1 Tax=Hahella sp. HNIBRBA332 TaxID=3015983 RepID=UPI00273B6C97|nr:hypothetical protein [Hahella sp. HNIBRBA332]WLQ11976.1 hypothetical protein O5O45_19800 [Hahella sp. HNIBRBA332]